MTGKDRGKDKDKPVGPHGKPKSTSPRRMPDKPMSDEERKAKDRERARKRYRRATDPGKKKEE